MQFDWQSNLLRIKTALQSSSSWANVLDYSSINVFLETLAKEEAELASYSNYALKESKWDIMKNLSSLIAQSSFLGYKPHRKIGATGVITVSSSSTFNQTYPYTISLPKYTVFSSSDDPNIKVCTIQTDSLQNTLTSKQLSVVQGIPKSFSTTAVGNPFEEFIILNQNIENTHYECLINGVTILETENLYLNTSSDMVFQIKNLTDFSGIKIIFGNNLFGKQLSNGDTVVFKYIETSGSLGNVAKKNVFTIVDSTIYDINNNPVQMYSKNEASISGGYDYEEVESIRANAPRNYQSGNRATSRNDYLTILKENPLVFKANVWGEYEYLVDNNMIPGELTSYVPLQENVVNIVAIKNTGENLSDSDKASIIAYLNDYKAITDIIQFNNAEFAYIYFISSVYVKDRSYSLATVKNSVTSAITDRYSLANTEFNQNVYETNYKDLIDNVDGVDHNTTTTKLFNLFKFEQANTATIAVSLYPVKQSTTAITSIKVYIQDPSSNSNPWIYVGYDSPIANINGTANFIGIDTYSLAGSNFDYLSGSGYILLSQTGNNTGFLNWNVKFEYYTTTADLIIKKRTQLFLYGTNDINVEYMV